ncbi:MAG: hypothetical protein GY833_22980 [Aestuariibacter sp.]|nr:hypothetical protein [Aestuariibacter sp.]
MSHQIPRANAILEKLTWGRGRKKKQAYLPILTEIAEYFLKELGVPSSVKVKISFVKMKGNQVAYLELSDGQTNNFEIKVNEVTIFRRIVRFLAHEITHLAQVVRGDLTVVKGEGLHWKGEKVLFPDGKPYSIDHPDTPEYYNAYKSLPHEAEAYGNMDKFFDDARKKFDRPIESLAELGIEANYFD